MKARLLAFAISSHFALAAFQQGTPETVALLRKMDERTPHFGEISRQIWEFAEVGYKETRSSALLKSELENAGFQIQERIAGIPTAFSATWGRGKPVIALLGEFDALPGLSQETIPEKRARAAGAPGHGCGHNLLGTAAAFAAITIKEHLAERKIAGTVRFYGTPAEEECAEAGALATETRMEMEIVTSVYNILPNDVLSALMDRNLRLVGGIRYTPEEQAFAAALRKSLPTEGVPDLGSQERIQEPDHELSSASTDLGDISWVVPTSELTAATWVPGTPADQRPPLTYRDKPD